MSTNPPTSEQAALFGNGDDRRLVQSRNSALWAAYADALGFISELTDEKGLKRRTRNRPLDQLLPWTRRIGGRGGVDVELPAGCWSDDTQLRLAVSRAITRHGFDVESFARIEMPVWPAYALGGGRASKAAAANLAKPDALWYANTYAGWSDSGGNGAAMRIQPHVWASRDLRSDILEDVITDSISTHGHPRAIVGACFHALTLAETLRTGKVPTLEACTKLAEVVTDAVDVIDNHRSLRSTWIGLWERQTGKTLRPEWIATVQELSQAITEGARALERATSPEKSYQTLVEHLRLAETERRGSAVLTTVAAVALAGAAATPYEAVHVAANAIGTDTDTIGTMTGALIGAREGVEPPPQEPLDCDYLQMEINRLTSISTGIDPPHHTYPDVLTWSAPQTQADALVNADGMLVVEGLGRVTELDKPPVWTPRKDFAWQWVQTSFGQTLLIKRRQEMRTIGAGNSTTPPPAPTHTSRPKAPAEPADRARSEPVEAGRSERPPIDRGLSLDSAVDYAKKNSHDNAQLGYALRRVARDGTLSDLVAFVTAIRDSLRH